MIVNTSENGWEIVYHRAHALMAAQIGGQWIAATRPDRWVEILAAITGHDDLAKEWEGHQLNEAGAPRDFRQESSESESFDPLNELIDSALYRGRWVAMLTSMHLCFLQAPGAVTKPTSKAFIDEQLKRQWQWRRELKILKKDADSAYAFMQWCDRLSLILALRQIPTRERSLEISKGPDGVKYDVMQHPDGTLNVTPWPFQDVSFMVRCEATYLRQLSFKSDESFVKALKTAEVKELCWTFSKRAQDAVPTVTSELYKPATT